MSKEGEALQRKVDEWLAMPLEQLATVKPPFLAFVFKMFTQRVESSEVIIGKADHMSLLRQLVELEETNGDYDYGSLLLQLKQYNAQFVHEQQEFAELFGEYTAMKPQLKKLQARFLACLDAKLEHKELTPEDYAEEKEGLECFFNNFHEFFNIKQQDMQKMIFIQQDLATNLREIDRLLPLMNQRNAQNQGKTKAAAKKRAKKKGR